MEREKRNIEYINILMLVLSSRVLVEFLSAFLGSFFRISSTSILTIGVFIVIYAYTLYIFIKGKSLRVSDLGWLTGIYSIYAINYLISDLKPLFFEQGMLLLYVFYIPFAILIVSNISNWNELTKVSRRYLRIDLILGLLTCFFALLYREVRMTDNSSYMTFSYAFLPIICITFLSCTERMDKVNFILAFASVISMLLYGARMCVFLAVIYLVFVYYFSARGGKRIAFILIGAIFIFIFSGFLGSEAFLNYIERIANRYHSHFLITFIRGNLFTSTSREAIYTVVRDAIKNMGDSVYGLFGDRHFTSSYSHSIIYESLLSFGWIGGVLFLTFVLFLSCRGLIHSYRNNCWKEFVLFFLCFLCKFFVSSSFATDWFFIFYIGATLSILRTNNTAKNEIEVNI